MFAIQLLYGWNVYGDEICPTLSSKRTTGLLCLHCMQSQAQGMTESFTEILERSCLQNVSLGFVTDGSFGFAPENIVYAAKKLRAEGRSVWIHIYFHNGPAQRRYLSNVFTSFATMQPALFRKRVRFDPAFRKVIEEEIRKLLPVLQELSDLGARVTLAPGLEDNLDNQSFSALLTLLKKNIPTPIRPRFVRSACRDCAAGNESQLLKGLMREHHTALRKKRRFSVRNGIVSNDGDYIYLDSDPNKRRGGSMLQDLARLRDEVRKLGNMFLLWVPKFQGTLEFEASRPPALREYPLPSEAEKREIATFLSGAQ